MLFHAALFLTDHFRSATGLSRFLRAYGTNIPVRTAQKWWDRGSIPSEWFPLLLAYLELDRGEPVSLAPYLSSFNAS